MTVNSIFSSRMPSAFVAVRSAVKPAGQPVTISQVPSGITAPGNGNCSSILPAGAVGCDANGNAVDNYGNPVAWPAATVGTPSGVSVSPITTPTKTVSDPNIQALYASVAPSIGITGDLITQAIQQNNDVMLANIKLSAQQRMAQLQAMSQQSMAAGNYGLAQQQIQEAAQLQQFNAQLSVNQNSLMSLYVIGAIVALGIVGAVVYLKPRDAGGRARRNPRHSGQYKKRYRR